MTTKDKTRQQDQTRQDKTTTQPQTKARNNTNSRKSTQHPHKALRHSWCPRLSAIQINHTRAANSPGGKVEAQLDALYASCNTASGKPAATKQHAAWPPGQQPNTEGRHNLNPAAGLAKINFCHKQNTSSTGLCD